ncbi:MAG: hypothetical protein RL008_435, partial [Actinomycetota bacterium]
VEQWQPEVLQVVSPRKGLDLTDYFQRYDECAKWRGLDRKKEKVGK